LENYQQKFQTSFSPVIPQGTNGGHHVIAFHLSFKPEAFIPWNVQRTGSDGGPPPEAASNVQITAMSCAILLLAGRMAHLLQFTGLNQETLFS
jgi:hypothetical protein